MYKTRSAPVFVLGLGLAAAARAPADDFDQWRGRFDRSGVLTEVVPPPLTPAWTNSLGSAVVASPVAADGRVYAATDAGTLDCLSAADGQVVWSFPTGGPLGASPAVDRGAVYLAGRDGTLYALRADSGQLIWKVFHGGDTVSSPLVLPDRVVFAVGHPSYEIRAFSRADGATLWAFNAGQLSASSPTLYSEPGFAAIVCGANNRTWYVLDPGTGAKLWEYAVGGGVVYGTAASGTGGQVAVPAGEYDRNLYVLDLKAKALVQTVTPQLVGGGFPGKPLVESRVGGSESSRSTGLLRSRASARSHPGGSWEEADPDFALLTRLPMHYVNPILNGTPEVREAYLKLVENEHGIKVDGLRKAMVERDKARAAYKADAASAVGRGKPSGGAPAPRFSHWAEGSIDSSSPVFDAGKLYVVQRDHGWVGDVFAVYRGDAATGASEGAYVTGLLGAGSPGFAPSPFVTGNYLYAAFDASLAVFNKADVSAGPLFTYDAGAPQVASPAAANGLVVAAAGTGLVSAWASANSPPGLPAAYAPSGGANVFNHFPTLSWTGAADPNPADTPATLTASLEYSFLPDLAAGIGVVRVDLGPGVAQYAVPDFIPANTRVFWRVRIRDAQGARSPWSPVQDFWDFFDPVPPDPPSLLSALAFDSTVQLAWVASASPDVTGYNVYVKTGAQSFAQATVTKLGNVTAATIGNLVNNTTYDFMATAVDWVGNESAGVVISAMPRPDISINGGGNFASIQQAIDAAQPGDTVLLNPKTFNVPGGITLKGGVSIKGYAPHLTILNGQGALVVLRVAGTAQDGRVAVENLAVTGGTVGVDTGNGDVLLRNLLVVKLAGDGIVTGAQGAVEGVSLTLADNAGNGIDVRTPLASLRGTIAAGNGQFGVQGPTSVSVTYSDFFGNARGPATAAVLLQAPPGGPDPGNLFVSVAFQDPGTFDYREKVGEASVDAGDPRDPYALEPDPNGGRINQGAFGNTPYATKSLVPIKGGRPGAAPPPAGAPAAGGGGGGGGLCFASAAASPQGGGVLGGLLLLVTLLRRKARR